MKLDRAIEIICDDYCKYSAYEDNVNRLADICDACPFNKLDAEQTEPQDECAKEYEELGLRKLKELRKETKTETQNSNLTFEKRTMLDCYNCKKYETEGECIECHYEAKDEPQTDCDGCQHYADEYTADACYECKWSYADRYEPQTERSE